MRPEGVLAAMATPFRRDGALNSSTLRRMVDFVVERGVDGIFAASTVGEFVQLSAAQRSELVALTVKYTDGRIPVLAGATDISPRKVIGHCREFKRAGASYATVAPPFYYPMKQADLVAHYEQIADSVDIPLVLYNIPQFTNPLQVDTMLEILDKCGPAALKNSSTSVIEMMELLSGMRGSGVSYLVGPDELILTGLDLGASGCITGLTGIVPEVVRCLADAYRAGRRERAHEIQRALLGLLRLVEDIPFPLSCKVLLAARGFDMGPPVQAVSAETEKKIERKRTGIARKLESILKLVAP